MARFGPWGIYCACTLVSGVKHSVELGVSGGFLVIHRGQVLGGSPCAVRSAHITKRHSRGSIETLDTQERIYSLSARATPANRANQPLRPSQSGLMSVRSSSLV